ncbi:MAG: hypothetical protein QM503_05070 [Bacteroidota bacterium]
MPAFSKEDSLTRLVGEYYNCTREDSYKKEFTYHSFINLDKKSREQGIRALRKYFNNNNSKILWAQIKCNISDEIIETLKVDPNFNPKIIKTY